MTISSPPLAASAAPESPASPKPQAAATPAWDAHASLAPIQALSQEMAECRKPPVNLLGALKRSRQISAHWRKAINDHVFPESERFRVENASLDAQVIQHRMERFSHMMPARDFVLHFGDRELRLDRGSITDAKVAAIVTAANAELAGGGGVDQVVHTAAGPALLKACKAIGGCETGNAVITPAFELQEQGVQHVIHAVGPVWRGGDFNEEGLLRHAYRASLELADAHGCTSIALPAISCGIYRYPLKQASNIALATVATYLEAHEGPLQQVVFVLFDDAVFRAFADTIVNMAS